MTILVTGGAGYVGSVLVPKLLARGHRVRVLDLFIYGNTLSASSANPNLEQIKGDIRNSKILERAMTGLDAVIHLACISNDPSFELSPKLGKSINYDAMLQVILAAKKANVRRFVYASSSSVYGIKKTNNVTEDLILEPLTDYSKFKAMGEEILMTEGAPYFTATAIRSATVCGYSPRMRFDLTVNILTNHAWNKGNIVVFGGEQKRPNIHIDDITDLYAKLLEYPDRTIHRKIYNAGAKNYTVSEIAIIVKTIVEKKSGESVFINYSETGNDRRSYHISSEKIFRELSFAPKYEIDQAVIDLCGAFQEKRFDSSLENSKYFNVKMMQDIKLV
jgi:nucleoside-diphosphate-sugar epimerase